MVVANCNRQVVIGYTYIVANGSSCCFFHPESRLQWSQYGRFHAVSLDTAWRYLLRNVSKFYAWQVVSSMNEQQSQNLLFKVDHVSRLFATDNELSDRARWRTRNITSAKLLLVFRRLLIAQRNITLIFFVVSFQKLVAKETSGLCVSKKLKVHI